MKKTLIMDTNVRSDEEQHLESLDRKYNVNDTNDKSFNIDDYKSKKVVEQNGKQVLVSNDEVFGNKEKFSFENKLGWSPIDIEWLPTKGMFYKKNTKIEIKSAGVDEIKHWSTLVATSFIQINEHLNYILQRCANIYDGDTKIPYEWDDIIEIDRLFLIFKISELTFPDKSNKLKVDVKCKGKTDDIYVTSDKLKLLELDSELYKIYDEKERCFVKVTKTNEEIRFYMPNVKIATAIKNYIFEKRNAGDDLDTFVIKILPYIINDVSLINDDYILKIASDVMLWNRNKLLYISGIVDLIEQSTKMVFEYKCEEGGTAIEMPLFFRNRPSIKNLFNVSEGLDDLI